MKGIAACLLLALCSCIAYRSGPTQGGDPEPGAASERPGGSEAKKSLSVLFRTSASYLGNDRPLPPYIVSQWTSAVLRGYRDSGLFSQVQEGIGRTSDLQATVRIENTLYASRGIGFLSAVSFLAIPSRNRDVFELKTTLTNQAGAVLGQFTTSETVTTYYQILLLPALPFLSRDAVVSRTLYDLSQDLAAQAQRKGVL